MLSRFLPPTLALGSAVCLLSQCEKPAPQVATAEKPLATVGEQTITADDLKAEAGWRLENRQSVPPAPALLKEMVQRLALVEMARREGVMDDPGTRRRIQALIITRLREAKIDTQLAELSVSDEEITRSYEARRDEWIRPGLDRFAILFQAAGSKASDTRKAEARTRLEEALTLADATPSTGGRGPASGGFGQVSADFSEDQVSRYRGGDIGWIETSATETRIPTAVIDAGRKLSVGERSGVIETDAGYYVIMKSDARPGGERPLAEVADLLRQELLAQKHQQLESRFLAEALENASATMDLEAVEDVDIPQSPPRAPSAPSLPAP